MTGWPVTQIVTTATGLLSHLGPLVAATGWETWRRVLLLEDYNTRVVVLGTTMLGMAAGIIGSFTLLRKRALMGDALSHATLPGIGLAFLIATQLGWNGKALPILLLGAAATGTLGMACILVIRSATRIKEDAALGIVLSVFFGIGVSILGLIQQPSQPGHAAGLEAFIYGKAASMTADDAWLISVVSVVTVVVSGLLFKEFKLLCFDDDFAGSLGYPVVILDSMMMGLVILVTIVGLQAAGLVLMIALLVIPAAAARFWTADMRRMAVISAGFGAASGMLGAGSSAILPDLPSGAMIVLVAAAFFLGSLIGGWERGIAIRQLRRRQARRRIDLQHLLRAAYEVLETRGQLEFPPGHRVSSPIEFDMLWKRRSWSQPRLMRQIRRANQQGLCQLDSRDRLRLTNQGFREAERLVREHRLWELYLITHADVATSKVDREADTIEHVLDPELIAELETLLEQRTTTQLESPHPISLDQRQRRIDPPSDPPTEEAGRNGIR